MKKTFIPFIIGLIALSSCEGFLESKNVFNKDLGSFYSNPTEISEGVAGMYLAMYNAEMTSEEYIAANVVDDLLLGGGEVGGEHAYFVDKFSDPKIDTYREAWTNTYAGVYRANAIIERLTAADFNIDTYFSTPEEAAEFKAQALGEAYFMRAYFYFRAARTFGPMPLVVTTEGDRNVPRSPISDVFAQIGYDLQMAIKTFPNKAATAYAAADYGHANKWIAQGYLARAYLYYTGYMTNIEKQATDAIPALAGAEGATPVAKADAIAALDDCITNSGYALLSDFRNLWPYSYVNEASVLYGDPAGEDKLPWAKTEGLQWAGQDGFTTSVGTGNSEVMFSIRYAFGSWSNGGQTRTNKMCLYFGLRDNQLQPFFQGWGSGSVHSGFFAGWDDADKRKKGSVLEVNDADNGTAGFQEKPCKQFTGLVQKKYQTLAITGTEYSTAGIFNYIYGYADTDMQLRHAQDFILLRFADVLLMKDELAGTADGINAVRTRAGLPATTYSLEALKEERMYEFAFEMQRWYDLVRWGDAYNGNNYYGNSIKVKNDGVEEEYTMAPPAEQKGLFPIPESEISISSGAGKYEQNPGWE